MTQHAGPLYEMNIVVTDDVRSDVDEWLNAVASRSREQPGIDDVHWYTTGDSQDGTTTQVCRFQLTDDASLDELLDGYFAEIDADAAMRFGDRVSIDSHIWRADQSHEIAVDESPVCLNCGSRLRGQYCGSCGQRSRGRLISIWELLREAFGDLLELDSRLWRTVMPLLVRPGQLTKDYLEGRRARYMPPFRTYLVLSLIFFVVAFFDPRDDLSLLFEPPPEPTAEEIAASGEDSRLAAEARDKQLEQARETLQSAIEDGEIPEEAMDAFKDGNGLRVSIGDDGDDASCTIDDDDWREIPDWLEKRLTVERAEQVCERIRLDEGKTFLDLLLDNIPIALIVLLPLMALVLKILYPLSRRYFVEHLLFFVHFHAFFFLILILEIIFARTITLLPLPKAIPILVLVAASLYVPVYLYMAMRRVYGQHHAVTFMKYVILLGAYIAGASLTLMGAVLFALLAV